MPNLLKYCALLVFIVSRVHYYAIWSYIKIVYNYLFKFKFFLTGECERLLVRFN